MKIAQISRGITLNLNIHFHTLFLNAVYVVISGSFYSLLHLSNAHKAKGKTCGRRIPNHAAISVRDQSISARHTGMVAEFYV